MADICESYQRKLSDAQISPPLAAILALTELCAKSSAGTMAQLSQQLDEGAELLKKSVSNPISLTAGCELFIAFITYFPHDAASFSDLKMELVKQGQTYVQQALTYRQRIANLAVDFIKDDAVILTHSYSRVVMETILLAHRRNKRVSVYVTEARPRGLGIKTAEALTAAGISCAVVLDSAVSYVIDKVDFVLVGSEAVVESGGLINAIGSLNIAIIAKAANKPFYALAESYKFHRLFPLSSDDLPSHNPRILSFTSSTENAPSSDSLTPEHIAQNNPDVDYTRPDLISLVFSELGSLTPSGESFVVGCSLIKSNGKVNFQVEGLFLNNPLQCAAGDKSNTITPDARTLSSCPMKRLNARAHSASSAHTIQENVLARRVDEHAGNTANFLSNITEHFRVFALAASRGGKLW
ncbi:Translation initiation factor eIF-2B subunit alpha [Mycena indigotica]|uniref:Translation initiation factor eIF2B subunit alpha n=1 Tax=Mycena indigotica TaxID=2126181 RepID=A0A8H6VV13_9AGAR|nr:Translation initiation factor eIF-2B subunit alpha [Mycena indigotica]KAF7294959.1 Translation initiation factor eIF-2B subunit alpha [Mycena indigotica]